MSDLVPQTDDMMYQLATTLDDAQNVIHQWLNYAVALSKDGDDPERVQNAIEQAKQGMNAITDMLAQSHALVGGLSAALQKVAEQRDDALRQIDSMQEQFDLKVEKEIREIIDSEWEYYDMKVDMLSRDIRDDGLQAVRNRVIGEAEMMLDDAKRQAFRLKHPLEDEDQDALESAAD
jgi:uncharacterized protein YbjQ (UPF0145 family)